MELLLKSIASLMFFFFPRIKATAISSGSLLEFQKRKLNRFQRFNSYKIFLYSYVKNCPVLHLFMKKNVIS